MEQHDIPQDIMNFEFQLFGNFTIRQFAYIGTGLVLGGLFLYMMSNGDIPPVLAIPLFVVSALVGLGLGVGKIGDMPTDEVVKDFFIAVTQPTMRVWKSAYMVDDPAILKQIEDAKSTLSSDYAKSDGSTGVSNVVSNEPIEDGIEEESLTDDELKRIANIENVERTSNYSSAQTQVINDIDNVNIPLEQVVVAPPVELEIDSLTNVIPQVATDVQVPNPNSELTTPRVVSSTVDLTPIIITQGTVGMYLTNDIASLDDGYDRERATPILLKDSNNNSVGQAVVLVKDSTEKLMEAELSNESGWVYISNQGKTGLTILKITHSDVQFPPIAIQLEGVVYPPIKIVGVKNES